MDELFDAIRRGDAAGVKSLVKANPAVLSAKSNNVSAVLTALYNGQNDVARLLVELGAPLDLYDACATGDLDRVRRMLGDDPSLLNRRSADGFPPLGLAIFFRQPDVAKFLIERGADVNAVAENAQRVAPVHAAAAVKDHQSMRMLLERGADPNAKQQMDVTPLHGAASRGDIDMAKLLLTHGADPHAATTDGITIAGIAEKYKQDDFVRWFRSAVG